MPIARFELPDGSIGRFEVPDGTTPEQAQAQISDHIATSTPKTKTVRDAIREHGMAAASEIPGWKKGLASLGSGMLDVGQGISQIARHGIEALPGVPAGAAGADQYDKDVAERRAYSDALEESTAGGGFGRAVGAAVPTLLLPAGKFAEGAGAVISKIAPSIGVKVAGSTLADAALMGATQAGTMATSPGESKIANAVMGAGAAAGTVGALTLAGKAISPVIRGIANRVNPMAIKDAGLTVADDFAGKGVSGLDLQATRAQDVAAPAAGTLTADVVRALEKQGIDVPSLTLGARAKLAQMAADSVGGTPVTPQELARAARLASLPVPIQGTAGQLSKDFGQNQLEQSLVKSTTAGAPIREAFATQNDKIGQNLDAFRSQTGAKIANEGDVGRSVNSALQARIDKSSANISALYRAAEKNGETMAPVNPSPLVEWLTENGAAAASVPAIKSVADTLKKFGAVQFAEDGTASAARNLSVNELENIRKMAVKLGKSDDATGHFMGEVKKVIDGMTEGAGGEAYQAARAARIQHALNFEEPGVIQSVVGMKSRTDRSVPFEDVFKKTVINGSIDDLKTLKGSLLANDKDTRSAGVQAFKDLRGQAMQYLKDAATNNAYGDTSEAALRRAYNQIGPEKMRELFGPNTTKQFENFLEAVKDLKVAPKGSFNPSGTAGELTNWIERILFSPLNPVGRVARVGVDVAKSATAGLKAANNVDAALNPIPRGNAAATLEQQNERIRALLDSSTARTIKRGAGAVSAAAVTQR